jgi:hypothetical protein
MFFTPATFLKICEADDDTKYVIPKGFKYQMKKKGRFQTFKGKPIMSDLFLYYPHKKDRLYLYVSDYFRTHGANVEGPTKKITRKGKSFPIPANTEKHLEATYGKGWKIPDPNFRGNYSKADVYGGPLKTKDLGGRYYYNFKTGNYIIK